jgi:PiT family inorganic phosphate transporter
LIALLAEAIVLFLFASKGLYNLLLSLGLPTIPLVPVSSTQVIVGAVVGIGLAKGGKNIRYNILGKISLAWVTAPVLAFLISFATLFVMQNVFELKVQQEANYIFDRNSITKIVEDGFDSAALSTVNGRSFKTEHDIYNELNEEHLLTRNEIMKIIKIAELYPLKIELVKLNNTGMHRRFTEAQLQVLKRYEGKTYQHKWQFKRKLTKHNEFKRYAAPANEREKNHNRMLDGKLEVLYRSFSDLDGKN